MPLYRSRYGLPVPGAFAFAMGVDYQLMVPLKPGVSLCKACPDLQNGCTGLRLCTHAFDLATWVGRTQSLAPSMLSEMLDCERQSQQWLAA